MFHHQFNFDGNIVKISRQKTPLPPREERSEKKVGESEKLEQVTQGTNLKYQEKKFNHSTSFTPSQMKYKKKPSDLRQ